MSIAITSTYDFRMAYLEKSNTFRVKRKTDSSISLPTDDRQVNSRMDKGWMAMITDWTLRRVRFEKTECAYISVGNEVIQVNHGYHSYSAGTGYIVILPDGQERFAKHKGKAREAIVSAMATMVDDIRLARIF